MDYNLSFYFSCSLCNKLVKLKRLLLLEGVPYCEPCFKQLFMRKGPQQHLEVTCTAQCVQTFTEFVHQQALQPREPREIGLGRRDSKCKKALILVEAVSISVLLLTYCTLVLQRYSQHPRANLTGKISVTHLVHMLLVLLWVYKA